MGKLYWVQALAAASLIATSASAHIELDDPPKRDAAMKTRPCGGSTPFSSTPKVFAPGQTVTVKWHETVVHPGFFRIALSRDGTTFPADPPDPPPAASGDVLAIVPKVNGVTQYTHDITLPAEPCDRCTIQVIQYMQQHSPPPYYYQCADITIRAGTPPAPTTTPPVADASDEPAAETSSDDSGCAVARSTQGGIPAWFVLGAAVLSALRGRYARGSRARLRRAPASRGTLPPKRRRSPVRESP